MEFDAQGHQMRKLYTQETPTVRAGNRFEYFPPVIDFSYTAVLNALSDAIEKEGSVNHAQIVDKIENTVEVLDYKAIRAEAEALWAKLVMSDPENPNTEMATTILKKAEIIFGHPIKLSEITEDQCDLYNLVLLEMRDLAK